MNPKARNFCLAALLLLAVLSPRTAEAKRIAVPRVYAFGLAASFTDSLVYMTDVQALDSAWIDTKSGFLQDRDQYAYQLRDYLADKRQLPHRTCIVFYDQKRERLEKKFQKMRRLYMQPKAGRQTFDVHFIGPRDFQFQVIDLSEEIAAEEAAVAEAQEQMALEKQQLKEEKQKKKASKKEKKQRGE